MPMTLLVLLACAHEAPAPTPPKPDLRMAITIDDLPWQKQKGHTRPELDELTSLNARIRQALLDAKAPATVFFNCEALTPGDGLVEAWANAGFEVGNHTFSHMGLHNTPVETWLEDARRCQEELEARTGEVSSFRFPYLQRGNDRATRDAADAGLAAMGLVHAPVTVATSEWVLAFAWRDAAPEDRPAIAATLRAHMLESAEQARVMAQRAVGRDVPQITLIHANELSADQLAGEIADLRAAGWKLIPLAEALQDPVYAMPDLWERKGGVSWLARVDPHYEPDLYWFGIEEVRLSGIYLR